MMKKLMKFRWLTIILGLTAATLMLSTAGNTFALFNAPETSNANQFIAWTSALWTQTTQADFNAGVLNNVETSSSPGDAKLPLPVTSFSPAGNTGNWANGLNGYSSNNLYATFTPSTTVSTKSPTTNTGAAWTTPANAYASDTNYATVTSGAPSGNNIWGTYGFSLAGDVITKVRASYDAFSPGATISFQETTELPLPQVNGGNITPALPLGWAANDIWLCLIASADNTNSTMPAGWTAIDSGTNNGSIFRTTLYWRRAVAGDVAPLITHTGGAQITASIVGYRGVITTGSPFDVNQPVFIKASASTVNNFGAGMTTTTNNDMIVLLSGANDAPSSSIYTGSPTPTERVDTPNANKYGDLIVADFTLATAGPTGARTSTLSPSRFNNGYQLSLKPAMPQIRVDVSWDGGTTWSAQQVTTLTQTKTTYFYDVTSAVAWDGTKLNDANFKVRVDAQTAGFTGTVSLDWLPVEVTYYDTSVWSHIYTTYGTGATLTGNLISKVEVGFEAFAASVEKIQVDISWDGGTTWSSRQTSAALGSSDPNATTWFDFTSATSWTPATLNDTNFKVRVWYLNNGAFGQISLDYLPVRVTYRIPSGTIASQVFDTARSGSRWDAIFWDEMPAANTNITFEVRASDTLFLKTDATPAWIAIGGTSPVSSSLPAGRYKQWRATLTTTAVANTPTLSEIRVYYGN
jgi:hypothetical protein